jgi:hypothetical protein
VARGPGQEGRQVGLRSGRRVARLANDHRPDGGQRSDDLIPAPLGRALTEQTGVAAGVRVETDGGVGVGGKIAQVTAGVARPVDAVGQDHVRSAASTDVGGQLGEAGRLPVGCGGVRRAPSDVLGQAAAVPQAALGGRPTGRDPVEIGLVVEVEDDPRIGLKGVRRRGPEGGRVVLVGSRVLSQRALRAGSRPVKVEYDIEARGLEVANQFDDRRLVGGAADLDAVDAEPAVFVDRNPDHVDPPGVHGGEGGGVVFGLAAEGVIAPVLGADGLGPGHVCSAQGHRLTAGVDQKVALDMERRGHATR